ncbi:MAG: 2-amino-4-hydroxy-6-hydroxymethyldihydropteridine diphosphokinase [Rhizobiales bacterium]|nr:2-amino-4-hydroxy-6-hydroxymethyldihydropteridine diphosphokinase [Hyphomicrobiales bacterium]
MAHSIIALGSNLVGRWGTPREALREAVRQLARRGVGPVAISNAYETPPFGPGRQAPYVNAALKVTTARSPQALLMLVKRLERLAGRRGGRRWGPRPLDIDIIDHKGRVARLQGKSVGMRPMALDLPHAGVRGRAFVLRPLRDVAPRWRHPVTREGVGRLLARNRADDRKIVPLGPL